MAKIKDLAVKVGSYNDNGKEKNRYLNIGSIHQKDDGSKFMMISRAFNPAGVPFRDGADSIMVSMFDVKDAGAYAPAQHQAAPSAARSPTAPPDFDDDLPF